MRKPLINFRAFLFVALSVTAAVFCAYLYAVNKTAGIVVGCVLSVAIAAVAALVVVKFIKKSANLRHLIAGVLSIVVFVCAFSVGAAVVEDRNGCAVYGGYNEVSGRVCSVNTDKDKYSVDLEDLKIGDANVDGIMRISVSATDKNIVDFLHCGDKLSFSAYVRVEKLVDGGEINGYSYRADIRYRATVGSDNIAVQFGKPNGLENAMETVRLLYVENMGDDYGNIAYGMLTGDKHALDHDVASYFSAAGIGHILAVSGLHIGFLVLLLNFLLSKLNMKVRFGIIGAILIGYAVIADFSPSVMRAVIMAYVSGIGLLIGGRRDLLSSLACAYSLILAVKPFYLFELGFQFSFGSIYGIALFSNSIRRFLEKRSAPRKLANTIGGSLSVSIGAAPAQAAHFNSVPFLSWVVNSVLLPYVSVIFVAIVCLTPIAFIPHCGPVLLVGKYLLMPLDYIAQGLASAGIAALSVRSSEWVFVCYPIMFMASEYTMFGKAKTAASWYSAAIIVLIFIVCAL